MDDIMRVLDLLLENLNFVGDVVTAAAVRGRGGIATAFGDASLAVAAEGGVHRQVVFVALVLVVAISVVPQWSLCLTTEQRIKYVACESLPTTDCIIRCVHILRLFQTESMYPLQALSFIFDLLWIGEV